MYMRMLLIYVTKSTTHFRSPAYKENWTYSPFEINVSFKASNCCKAYLSQSR